MAEKNETTHTLLDRELIVYRRERSNIWQCRFKVDGIWQRASTKERGVGVRVLMALAGHSSMATTQRYIDLRPAMLKAAVELV